MLKRYSFLAILILIALLTGCSPQTVAQPAEVRALENPASTAISEPSVTAEITKPEVVPQDPPPSCPVTTQQAPAFVPPSPYDSLGFEDAFWYGSSSLWIAMDQDGTWSGLPYNQNGYSQKVFWWREGYVWNEEPEPELIVTGERLDASAPPLLGSRGTNAYASDIGSAMLTGVGLPTLGCWKITGKYGDAELSFIVWAAP
jgi:hypothetical protein